MKTSDIKMKIGVEIESVCKITCFNTNCKHRLRYAFFCNLKNIEIDEEGQCTNFDEIVQFVITPLPVSAGSILDNTNWSNPLSDNMDPSGCGHDHK